MLNIDEITPINGKILVKRLPPKASTAGGLILLPETQNFKNRTCQVLKVHAGRKTKSGAVVPCEVKVGDLVELIVFDGEEFGKHENQNIEWADDTNVLAVWDKTDE